MTHMTHVTHMTHISIEGICARARMGSVERMRHGASCVMGGKSAGAVHHSSRASFPFARSAKPMTLTDFGRNKRARARGRCEIFRSDGDFMALE
jgi:hypothetical protein